MSKQFEYKMLHGISDSYFVNTVGSSLMQILPELGLQGWELVTTSYENQYRTWFAILKRDKHDK